MICIYDGIIYLNEGVNQHNQCVLLYICRVFLGLVLRSGRAGLQYKHTVKEKKKTRTRRADRASNQPLPRHGHMFCYVQPCLFSTAQEYHTWLCCSRTPETTKHLSLQEERIGTPIALLLLLHKAEATRVRHANCTVLLRNYRLLLARHYCQTPAPETLRFLLPCPPQR